VRANMQERRRVEDRIIVEVAVIGFIREAQSGG
jgi:hypothetical protein